MRVLIIHPNMPGQYKHIARALGADKNVEVVFLTKPTPVQIPGVQKIEYQVNRAQSHEIHRYLISFEKALLHGQEVWRVLKKAKSQGFEPDIVIGHPGWGEGLFIKDLYPKAKVLFYFEFFYHSFGADTHFNPNDPILDDEIARIRVKNAPHLINLESCDWGISPTHWQASLHPKAYQDKISILHEGIDTTVVRPDPSIQSLELSDGFTMSKDKEIITYVARNLEPYRGFPTFMKSLEILLKERPNAHVVIVGKDGVSYGKQPTTHRNWREKMISEVKLDYSRVHFTGSLPYPSYLKVLNLSSIHIYLTVPFVLSWSLMESMACGCLLVASKTAPVEEVIDDGIHGNLTDFFDHEALSEKIIAVLENKDGHEEIRQQARERIIKRYELSKVLPLHLKLIHDLANSNGIPEAAKEISMHHQQSS